VTWRWARLLEGWLGTRRLQPQLLIIICLAIGVAALPLWNRTGALLPPPTAFDPVFAMIWMLGGLCAISAAYLAKFHRFAALILLGGSGLVPCLTFVWFSAPDLALTQLVVEIVTTVLILLGLRWLPQRSPDFALDATGVKDRFRRYRDL